jgi:hypothetical protein
MIMKDGSRVLYKHTKSYYTKKNGKWISDQDGSDITDVLSPKNLKVVKYYNYNSINSIV